jgi:hypothetical protein
MPRSSHGSSRATTWAVAQTPKPLPRIVRLGRAANDNGRDTRAIVRMTLIALAAAFAAFALIDWWLI